MFLEFYIGYCLLDVIFFLKKESSYFTLLRIFLFVIFAAIVYQDAQYLEKINSGEPQICIQKPSYEVSYDDLGTRPPPKWYSEAAIGIHVYWSVLSVPDEKQSFWKSYFDGEWTALTEVRDRFGERFTYASLASQFTAQFFDADDWMTLFRKAGARYVVVSAKSEDGFALYPSKHSFNWNSVDVGPKKDLLGLLGAAAMKANMKFGVSYSLHQWPLALENEYGVENQSIDTTIWSDVKQLLNDYPISVLRVYGDWEAEEFYKQNPDFVTWVYNESPRRHDTVVTDAWDYMPPCDEDLMRYGREIEIFKREPELPLDEITQYYRRTLKNTDVLPPSEMISQLITAVAVGYNCLINVAPTPDGMIPPIIQERLLQLGEWLEINGEVIYGTYPWVVRDDSRSPFVKYLGSKPAHAMGIRAIYAVVTEWPSNNVVTIGDAAFLMDTTQGVKYELVLLGQDPNDVLEWTLEDTLLMINLPKKSEVLSEYAWTIKFRPAL